MNRKLWNVSAVGFGLSWLVTLLGLAPVWGAEEGRRVISLWPAGTAGVNPAAAEEIVPRGFELVKNIHNPTLTVFRPQEPQGVGVVICPGGGYRQLATGLEGYPVAEKLNEQGITAFVLKYRLPTTNLADFKHPVPLSDALRAIQWVRHHAADYQLDPQRIGIMGFSAGGHLAATAGTLYAKYRFGSDEVSRASSRPDFLCLGYPVISTRDQIAHGCVRSPLKKGFTPEDLAEMSCELQVRAATPPTFLFHAQDDRGVLPQNSIAMHEALQAKGVASELKLYRQGGHGFGLGRPGTDSTQWLADFVAWLRKTKILAPETEFYTPPQDRDGLQPQGEPQAGLPNVLLIGDSISIGYTKPTVKLLRGLANVQRVKANCGDTNAGLRNLQRWLGDTRWDVIHFNWGLHDLCYRDPNAKVQGHRDKVRGRQAVPLAEYEKNLERLVQKLKQTGATLIWASTTVVPEGEVGRFVGDDVKYNAVAAAIMRRHGIAINDLHALTASFPPELFVAPGNVHYVPDGSAQLAAQVAQAITERLSTAAQPAVPQPGVPRPAVPQSGASLPAAGPETLPVLKGRLGPQTLEEMWAGFDPRAEPLEVEVLQEWEEDGVRLRVLCYRVGIFKGQKAIMAAVYGYPRGGRNLPGLVQIHGGGQYADYRAALTNAQRGYATISLAWAGRIAAPTYRVTPHEVRLFWEQKTEDPAYKQTTDWGALDAYHAPSRNGRDAFGSMPTASWTLDEVESPRNNSWFLCTLAARRALTFLEQQPEVDAGKLGVYGHSMGGKMAVMTAASDTRVKAAAPSCGGISDRYHRNPLHRQTVGDATNLEKISCPTIFLSPANDFHGQIHDLIAAVDEIQTSDWRVICSPHRNHQDLPESEVATQLWFDQYLQGTFSWPQTPSTSLVLKTATGVPAFLVTPDASRPIESVDVYYTQQDTAGGEGAGGKNRVTRFWHVAAARPQDGVWTAQLPLFCTDQPLWVYAHVVYRLPQPITGAGYYYGIYSTDK
ncbi:MAG: prolyl oligopeptidase family serine peptidase, partial [Planctomycetales bacterium]|nr:prolyl oligopeptidase family serine peptidase [Planctomycetales bacterium]NIN08863.1 prolyl oligopeptidase family serine peptidase [Planctomycetales bacterium]NIN77980.1 prolyl oligopeptidase family serine peptidase [Planctomycetales bacterium]NIO35163.1 prolyl oligopeptidase family serine peptidase [Planctomycetales bacterium]NIO46916.1 prolyl oligopeptidase family serine peptidase [Planctomycetales bacterium]